MGFGSKLRKKVGMVPPKELTYEENQEMLDDLGIIRKKTPEESRYKEKFSAYGAMAKNKFNIKNQELVPEGYEDYSVDGATPYIYNRHTAKPESYTSGSGDHLNLQESYNPYKNNVVKADKYTQDSQNGNSDSYNPYSSSNNSKPFDSGSNLENNAYTSGNPYSSNKYNQPFDLSNNPYSVEDNNYNSLYSQSLQSDNNPYSSSNNNYNKETTDKYKESKGLGLNESVSALPSSKRSSSLQTPRTAAPYTSSRINPYKNNRERKSPAAENVETFDFEDTDFNASLRKAPTNNTDFNSAPVYDARGGAQISYAAIPEMDGYEDFNDSIHEQEQVGGYSQDQLYQPQQPVYSDDQYYDFNNEPEEQVNNYTTFEDLQRQQQEQQQREEDEEVDTIKQQIKFTKQSSVASTRNTLKMAKDAEMAGLNTLGMLGSQTEKLGNIENNLTLLKIHNREADDKVSELKKLNRSVFAVHVSNPFTSKRRARETEERIKSRREMDKEMQHDDRRKLYDSTNAVSNAITTANNERLGKNPQIGADSIRERYTRNEILNRNKKFAFEGDEEDEDLEVEIDQNLNDIGAISKRLKNIALSQSEEVKKQSRRLNEIENDTDDLDIKLYWNTKRLQDIK
ncbi:hypothetical protein QEN19_001669 [Hanseniaspora menglaensis]